MGLDAYLPGRAAAALAQLHSGVLYAAHERSSVWNATRHFSPGEVEALVLNEPMRAFDSGYKTQRTSSPSAVRLNSAFMCGKLPQYAGESPPLGISRAIIASSRSDQQTGPVVRAPETRTPTSSPGKYPTAISWWQWCLNKKHLWFGFYRHIKRLKHARCRKWHAPSRVSEA